MRSFLLHGYYCAVLVLTAISHCVEGPSSKKKKDELQDWDTAGTVPCVRDHDDASDLLELRPGSAIKFKQLKFQNVPDIHALLMLRRNTGHTAGPCMPGTLKKTQSALGRLAWVMLQANFAEADSLSKKGGFLWSITMEIMEHKNTLIVMAGKASGSSSGSQPITDGISVRQ